MSTFGSTTEDSDGVPKKLEQRKASDIRLETVEEAAARGEPVEGIRDWASPEDLRREVKLLADAKESLGKVATIEGLAVEVDVLKKRLAATHEQMNTLIKIYGTLQNQFTDFQAQRTIELQSWLAKNGGSTTPEDNT